MGNDEPAAAHELRDDEDAAALGFIEEFALLLAAAGVPRMAARVFACVLTDDDGRVTAAQLARRLRVSPAAVSGAVRYLVDVGLLVRGREPGARTDHYRLGDDVWYEMYGQRAALLERWEAALGRGIELLGPDRAASRRLEETREFFAFLRAEIPPMMRRWRDHRSAPRG